MEAIFGEFAGLVNYHWVRWTGQARCIICSFAAESIFEWMADAPL